MSVANDDVTFSGTVRASSQHYVTKVAVTVVCDAVVVSGVVMVWDQHYA